jgi:hypothetical protein
MEQEDIKWRQRSKTDWLQFGDKNSKFFHACANQRRRSNQIHSILDEQGLLRETQEDIGAAFTNYFNNLFATDGMEHMEEGLIAVEERVTGAMNETLLQPFNELEIRTALFQMGPLKAPGSDGLNAGFFQKNWEVVGPEVSKTILSILNSGEISRDFNSTFIALIPKTKNPLNVTDFRPISLCNVIYKMVSKVLANRLKLILPHIISSKQSAFIPRRLITDNVLAAYKTLHTMHANIWGRQGYMAVKIDMSKAYDRVEWEFLRSVMSNLGFDPRWIRLIMMCVTTANYEVLVNGIPAGRINPTRGIRQGDPISPYLFLICAEALSAMLTKADNEGVLRGVPSSKRGPRLNHLFFADDSLLFCRADLSHWNRLSTLLKSYELASGQRLNVSKTAIFFSRNTTEVIKEQILEVAGIPSSQRYDKYLGLPALVGKSRMKEFKGIRDRVWKRLQDWKLKLISQAGKEILLKTVIQAIPTFCMSVFRLPKVLCSNINTLMRKFWWGASQVPWMSWNKLGESKDKGGMGFRDLGCFNKALLAKQGWRLWKEPDSLVSKIMKAKYYPNGSFLESHLGNKPSFAWRSIWGAKRTT